MKPTLFLLTVRNQINIYGGAMAGVRYSMDKACPVCGTGATRLSPINYPVLDAPIPQPKLPKKVFLTLDFEVIVPPEVTKQMKSLCPACILPLVDSETGSELPYAQLVEEATLPPFNKDKSKGFEKSQHALEKSCPRCQRDGFFGIPKQPFELVYDILPEDLLQKDVLATWECFGKSRLGNDREKMFIAMPQYVLSERMAAIFHHFSNVSLDLVEWNQ